MPEQTQRKQYFEDILNACSTEIQRRGEETIAPPGSHYYLVIARLRELCLDVRCHLYNQGVDISDDEAGFAVLAMALSISPQPEWKDPKNYSPPFPQDDMEPH